MTLVDNRSCFAVKLFSLPDSDGQRVQLLVISATYTGALGHLQPADEQMPVTAADEHFGDPASSSVRYEAQIAMEKRRVDVLVNGTAYAPGARPTPALVAELHAGEIHKRVRVIGDRFRMPGGPSSPKPFLTMPVIYERAYGGTDTRASDPAKHLVWRQNPVGLGFRGVRSHMAEVLTEFPNLEPVGSSMEGPPAGFGIVGRAWSPRLEWAGKFDEAWLANRWPLLPLDFDMRHNQAAQPDQQTETLRTGDPLRLVNFSPGGVWECEMPSMDLPAWLIREDGIEESKPRLDTILLEPDQRRVLLTWRLKIASIGKRRLREIVVGDIERGRLLAKQKRKKYLDMPRMGGSEPKDPGV